MWNPRSVHYASLGVALLLILVIGRDQWFFGDDWAILAPRFDAAVLVPHVGHWNLGPAVVFPLVRNWLGLGSYLPYLALAVLVHLAVAHLSWRIMNRVGVSAWVSTLLAALVMVLGAAAENILWAFQFGFMGAILLGLGVVLLVDRPAIPWAAVIPLSMAAVTFSSTAIPVLAAAGVVAWVRHGLPKTLLALLPSALMYLAWYLLVSRQYPSHVSSLDGLDDVPGALLYGSAMYVGGLGRMFPLIVLGVVPAAAVAVWLAVTVRRGIATSATAAYALAIGSAVFVGMTAWSRSSLGLTAAASQRYAYLTIVLLLPALGLLLSWLAARGKPAFVVTTVALVGLVGFNGALLAAEAAVQSDREFASRDRVLRTLELVLEHPGDETLLTTPADPEWSPDLLGSDLVLLAKWRQLLP